MYTFTTKYFVLILGFQAKVKNCFAKISYFVRLRKMQNFAKKQSSLETLDPDKGTFSM